MPDLFAALAGRPRLRMLVAALAGVGAALGQAPLNLWPATLVGLAVLYGLLRETHGWRQAAALGWAGGTGYFLLALSWIVEPFLVDAARYGWMAPFALVLMGGGLALLWALGFALARLAGATAPAFVAALVLAEALRARAFTGFPWAQPGHALISTPLLHWASLGGALLLTALMAGGAAALWHLVAGPRRLPAALTLGVLAALWPLGQARTPDAAPAPDAPVVRLVQPNAAQRDKWDPAKAGIFYERQLRYTAAPGRMGHPALVVWPETAIPVPLEQAGPVLARIAFTAGSANVVLGVERYAGRRIYNSLVALDHAGRQIALYDKHHLVPFGEYIPYGDWLSQWGIHGLAAEAGQGFSAGPGARTILLPGLGTALPLICYEGVFARDVRAAAARPDFMLLITNDAWFGTVSGPYQHLAQARLRSAEMGLPMMRAANTGISAMIDASGRVRARLGLGKAGFVDARLPPALPPTPYARTGDAPMLALSALLLVLSFLYHIRKTRRE